MAFSDVEERLDIIGYSDADEATIRDILSNAYDGSATAKEMFDDWIATPDNRIVIRFEGGALKKVTVDGKPEVRMDLDALEDLSLIDNNGTAREVTVQRVLVHELVHALKGVRDNYDLSAGDFQGDTVKLTNTILNELGVMHERNSYIAVASHLEPGFEYTNGAAIDGSYAEAGSADLSTVPAGDSNDLLVGASSANKLHSGDGNDFLFGNGGNDELNGGNGTDTGVLKGKPTDYDVRLNDDGTWTSRHVRGDADEGTDTFISLEKVTFKEGGTFDLRKNGLTYQTDFAFVIDTTGSMGDDIDAVKAQANAVLDALFSGDDIDARIGVVSFKDNTIGEPTAVVLPFTDHDDFADRKSAATAAINGMSVSGGGDLPETAFDGLLTALDGSMGEWRVGAGTKRIALFTDAPAKDVGLLPTVVSQALDVGAVITSSSHVDVAGGAIDTFEFSFAADDGSGSAGFFPPTEPDEELPPFVPSDVGPEPLPGTGKVQIFTIFTGPDSVDTTPFEDVGDETGGRVLTAESTDDIVDRLLEIIEAVNYQLTVDPVAVDEGDDGTTLVTYTLSRDQGDAASLVTLAASGTADSVDVTGVPDTVSFAAGETVKEITVSVVGDLDEEDDETFGLAIAEVDEPSAFSTAPVVFTIRDDDDEPTEITGTEDDDDLVGTPGRDLIDALAGDDTVRPGGGDDEITLGDGADEVRGSAPDLFGDTLLDFTRDDRLVFEDEDFDRDDVTVADGSAVLSVDTDGDGTADGSVTLEGDFSDGDFMAVLSGSDTEITFENFLPVLADEHAVDPALINGVINQKFLNGDNASTFEITLLDLGFALFDNVLGAYEITDDGSIVDVRILSFNANDDKGETITIDGVEAGRNLGFFIVQDAADEFAGFDASDSFAFTDGDGGAASVGDGADLILTVNGTAMSETIFHSFSPHMNPDDVQHALSGVDEGGESFVLGFEDLTGGGDTDYEDVAFRIETVEDGIL